MKPGYWRAVAIASTCALVLCLALIYLRALPGRDASRAAIITEVHKLNRLVTVRYSIQRVVGLKEPKVPFGEESLLLMVQGEVLAGVDLGGLRSADLTYTGRRTIAIALPPARVFDSFIDEHQTKIWDHSITWWTPWVPYDQDLEHKARMQAIGDIREAALKMGILDQAQKNAQTSIRELLSAFDLRVDFKTRPLD